MSRISTLSCCSVSHPCTPSIHHQPFSGPISLLLLLLEAHLSSFLPPHSSPSSVSKPLKHIKDDNLRTFVLFSPPPPSPLSFTSSSSSHTSFCINARFYLTFECRILERYFEKQPRAQASPRQPISPIILAYICIIVFICDSSTRLRSTDSLAHGL